MKKVLAFGAFDPLHKGHLYFLQQAKNLGDHLTVVVTRDSAIRDIKSYESYQSESRRLTRVQGVPGVNQAILGSEHTHSYELLEQLDFDLLAIGYDQLPTDEEIYSVLKDKGKTKVKIARLSPFQPDKFKGAIVRAAANKS